MDKIIQPQNPMVGVAYGAVATCDLSIGPRYHALWLEIIATPAAATTLLLTDVIDLINVKINGKVQRAHTGTELNAINTSYDANLAMNGYETTAGVPQFNANAYVANIAAHQTTFMLPIFFAEPWRKSYAATESGAWYTSWADGSVLRSFQLEVSIPAATANILANSAITINVYAETDNAVGPLDANKQPVALITKWNRLQIPYGGAGDLYITNLPKKDIYTQLSIFSQTGDDVTAVKVKVDSRIVRDVTKLRNDQTLIGRGFNEAACLENRFDVVFDYSDLPTDGLVMQAGNAVVKDFTVIATLGAANAANKIVTVLSQLFGGID
jgi:hypothetical protein